MQKPIETTNDLVEEDQQTHVAVTCKDLVVNTMDKSFEDQRGEAFNILQFKAMENRVRLIVVIWTKSLIPFSSIKLFDFLCQQQMIWAAMIFAVGVAMKS